MVRKTTQRKGGRGRSFEIRNELIIRLRTEQPRRYTFGVLGEIFGMNKKTIYDIFSRDRAKYAHK